MTSNQAETTHVDTPDPKFPTENKPYEVQMDLRLFHRRKRLLLLHYSGNLTNKSLEALAQQENVKEINLWRDWKRRQKWEPFIWASNKATKDAEETLKFLQLAREKAIHLMNTAGNDNARVGAVGKLVGVVKAEIELRQSLGLLPRVNMEPIVKVDVNVSQQVNINETIELLKRYDFLFKTTTPTGTVQQDHPTEQVDPAQTSNNP